MTAVARVHFDSAFVRVPAELTAVLFRFNFRGHRAIAQVMGAFDTLLHTGRIPLRAIEHRAPGNLCGSAGCCRPAGARSVPRARAGGVRA